MADNLSVTSNNDRFVEYPYDIRKDSWTELQQRRIRLLTSRVRSGEIVLDVGCNSGFIAEFLPRPTVVHGVDLSPALVEIAKTRLASAQVASAELLPFEDKSFSTVIIGEILEYVFNPTQVLHEQARVARRAIVGSADHESGTWGAHRVDQHQYMVRSFTEASLREALKSAGDIVWFYTLDTEYYLFEVHPHG